MRHISRRHILQMAAAGPVLLARPVLAADRYAGIRTVSVVSVLGDKMLLEQKGDLINNTVAPAIVFDTGLNLDAIVQTAVATALAGRFSTIDAPIDPAYLESLSVPTELRGKQTRGENTVRPDAYIVVHPDMTIVQTPIRALTYAYSGARLTRITKFIGDRYGHALSFSYRVTVLNGATGRRIDYGDALPTEPSFLNRPPPFMGCNPRIWPGDPSHVDETEALQLRADILAYVARSLPIALQSAHLVQSSSALQIPLPSGVTPACKPV